MATLSTVHFKALVASISRFMKDIKVSGEADECEIQTSIVCDGDKVRDGRFELN